MCEFSTKIFRLALLRLKSPAVRKHLNQNGTELRWRKWVQHLNLQVLVNFFDCLFMEGPKVKFRFGLAYLNILAKLGNTVYRRTLP